MAVASMHLGVWSWSIQSPELQTECQNKKERGFKQFWAWHDCWCQTGRSEYFTICPVTGIFFTHNHFQGLQRMLWKSKNIQYSAVMCVKTEITTCYNRGMQQSICEATTTHNLEVDGLQQQKTPPATTHLHYK